jgi:hypothetical protein
VATYQGDRAGNKAEKRWQPSRFAISTPRASCASRNGTGATRNLISREPPRASSRRSEVSPKQAKNSSSRSDLAVFAIAMRCRTVRINTAAAMANRTPSAGELAVPVCAMFCKCSNRPGRCHRHDVGGCTDEPAARLLQRQAFGGLYSVLVLLACFIAASAS